jgi:hypothetical protein
MLHNLDYWKCDSLHVPLPQHQPFDQCIAELCQQHPGYLHMQLWELTMQLYLTKADCTQACLFI